MFPGCYCKWESIASTGMSSGPALSCTVSDQLTYWMIYATWRLLSSCMDLATQVRWSSEKSNTVRFAASVSAVVSHESGMRQLKHSKLFHHFCTRMQTNHLRKESALFQRNPSVFISPDPLHSHFGKLHKSHSHKAWILESECVKCLYENTVHSEPFEMFTAFQLLSLLSLTT